MDHRVEMYHSKLSGKKKLCVDRIVVVQDKSYRGNFIYSFKLDKHYLNVVQVTDKFDLRIDNRSFDDWMKDERSGKLKTSSKNLDRSAIVANNSNQRNNKIDQKRSFSQVNDRQYRSKAKNSNDEFFNDADFNFETGNFHNKVKDLTVNDKIYNGNKNDLNAGSFSQFTNQFSNSGNNFGRNSSTNNLKTNIQRNRDSSKTKNNLFDISDIVPKADIKLDNKDVLKDIAFEFNRENAGNNQINMNVFNHNRNILNNLNLDGIANDSDFVKSNKNSSKDFSNQFKNTQTSSPTINTQGRNINNQINYNPNNQMFFANNYQGMDYSLLPKNNINDFDTFNQDNQNVFLSMQNLAKGQPTNQNYNNSPYFNPNQIMFENQMPYNNKYPYSPVTNVNNSDNNNGNSSLTFSPKTSERTNISGNVENMNNFKVK